MTPLHLAVTSGKFNLLRGILLFLILGNTKVIHKLMIRGADKWVLDANGKTP